MDKKISFELVVNSIKDINHQAGNAAKGAVNQLFTLRNWAIGYYIVEYEQNGSDRAEYGGNLLKNLEASVDEKGLNITLLKTCRLFYLIYPQISSTVSNQFVTSPETLIKSLSFSHIRELLSVKDSFERFFYETECIKCGWDVRELRRQIKTNLYIRAGISKHPEELLYDAASEGKKFELNRSWWFTCQIIHYTINAFYFIDDSAHYSLEYLKWYLGAFCRHEIYGVDCTKCNSIIVGSFITHNTNGTHVCQCYKVLAYTAVKTSLSNLILEEITKWLNNFLEINTIRKAAYVVMRFISADSPPSPLSTTSG